MNLQNRGVYYYQLFIYSKIIPFFVEKTAEPAFVVVVVVETYLSFAVALTQIAVVVAAAAVADSAVVAEKLAEFAAAAAAVAVVLAL